MLACAGPVDPRADAPLDDTGSDAARDDAHVPCSRQMTITFVPTAHAQIAIWAEAPTRFATIALTEATAYRGIGNRPGAMQMDTALRWPYGRREDVLPGWAGARLASG